MFGISPQNREVFPNNFLRSVHLRATYSSTPKCSEERNRFKELFAETMPKAEDANSVKIHISRNGNTIEENQDEHRLVLHSNDMQQEMAFSNKECSYGISGDGYKNFDEMRKQYQKALAFAQTCGVHALNSLMLRKVNVLQFEAESQTQNFVPIHGALNRVVEPDLLLQYDHLSSINPHIKQSMQSLVLEDNGYELLIKYGFETIRRKNESRLVEGVVVIDLTVSKRQVVMDDVERELEIFNDELFSAFRWTVTSHAINQILKNNG
ncbi:MAG: TIGR04255 family protein [Bacteroidaceae bacterium]|nr:TIGR04255 family protein [Bacteroidaceae bacterium]